MFNCVYQLSNWIYFIFLTQIIAGLDLYILKLGCRYNTFSHYVTGEQRKWSLLRHAAVNSFVRHVRHGHAGLGTDSSW